MSRYFYYDTNGRVVSESSDQQPERDGIYELRADAPLVSGFSHYVQDGALRPKGERPSPSHTFNYITKQWKPNLDTAWALVKQKRTQLLSASDWVVTRATESGQPVPPEWLSYRQALRDITLQADPLAIVWPVSP